MTVFKEFAPAKINLTLRVLGKRPDGYHELESLVAFADAGDYVTLDVSKPVGVTMSGPFAGSIAGENLLSVTLRRLSEAESRLRLGAVHLEKNLPVAAGIGGGSADAAAVIRAVQRANPDRIDDVDWRRIALRVGADVPVCIVSHLAWMRGIGEIVAPLKFTQSLRLDAVIVNPLIAVPEDKTARVFRAYAAEPNAYLDPPKNHPGIHNRDDLLQVVSHGWNDLQFAASQLLPEIDVVLRSEMQPVPIIRRMSGSGPTCFAIFGDQANAVSAAAMLQQAHPEWWVKAVTLG